MSVTPRIALIAMEAQTPSKAFVRVPNEPGRWILADRCVVEVECPQCHAAAGEPCHNGKGHYWVGTHYRRRHSWRHGSSVDQRSTSAVIDERPRIRVRSG